jgi:hypothetical protein
MVQGLKKREKAFPGAGEWMGGGKDSVRVGGFGGRWRKEAAVQGRRLVCLAASPCGYIIDSNAMSCSWPENKRRVTTMQCSRQTNSTTNSISGE